MASDQKKIRLTKKNRLFRIPKYTAWFYPRRTWYGEGQNVYLTFDDGPHPEITPWLLDELKNNQIQATFFWLGSQVAKYPELLERAIEEGHSIGHHGHSHLNGKDLQFDDFKNNFDQSKVLINSQLFRPPYGKLKRKQAKYASENGQIIMWSWMSYDFDLNLSVAKILELAKREIRSKDILIFHENDKTRDRIKEIIPAVIQIVREKGLSFEVIKSLI